jgi:hypothetical protein
MAIYNRHNIITGGYIPKEQKKKTTTEIDNFIA